MDSTFLVASDNEEDFRFTGFIDARNGLIGSNTGSNRLLEVGNDSWEVERLGTELAPVVANAALDAAGAVSAKHRLCETVITLAVAKQDRIRDRKGLTMGSTSTNRKHPRGLLHGME